MRPERAPRMESCALDVRAILQRSVASLYSHLVTRPTGRAVREAIEIQLGELSRPALSLVDFSSVSVLDYSCADEVVAKLLQRESSHESAVFFVLTGVRAHHREPIGAVLERHRLAVVAQTASGRFELMGTGSDRERDLWGRVEARGRVPADLVPDMATDAEDRIGLDRLIRGRLLFRDPARGDLHALSTLIHGPGTEDGSRGFK